MAGSSASEEGSSVAGEDSFAAEEGSAVPEEDSFFKKEGSPGDTGADASRPKAVISTGAEAGQRAERSGETSHFAFRAKVGRSRACSPTAFARAKKS